ncbi:neprilysin-1 [Rhipicephalus sanguineus]|uniref:neprilysin-1 n=1 Tax=Rhipicephalus sanguineus TaxID=34632 RepID=UPI0018944A93|nr:neprilysin-1 [Rhipicephalus sanguineus]
MDRLKQKRSSARAQNTKIINEATAILESDSVDRATIIALKERLTSSNEKLKKISDEMEDHIPTEELASEYAADYEDQVVATLARLQCRIEDINNAQRAVDAGDSASTVHAPTNVGNAHIGPRLPRLEIKPFNGNIREWTTFWEQFEVDNIVLNKTMANSTSVFGPIRGLGQRTGPYITEDEWASAFIKHTNNIYDGDDAILYKEALLDVLVELFESVDAGVMNRESVKTATSMVQKLREAFRTAFSTSSWVTGVVREVAIKKLENMQHYVGSPGQRLDPAKIDNYYDAVPDVDTKRFFKAYRGALQASTHRSWTDQKNWIFDETTVNAYYTIGHEIMHGYDVGGSMYDEKSMQREWGTPEFMKKYTERTLCLRESHRAAEAKKARQGVLNDTVDSENLADFVGTALAHAAFASLPSAERNLALPGLNLTAEHLFFIGSCAKLCARQNVNSERYAASRFRCNVPLMNMAEFSSAFGCAPESPMNPSKKCAFWS